MRLIVELTHAEPVAGSVRSADGMEREFTTWLGLMAALREAVGDDGTDDDSEDGERA